VWLQADSNLDAKFREVEKNFLDIPVGHISCDSDGVGIWSGSNHDPLNAKLEIQVPNQLNPGTKALYAYMGSFWVPSEKLAEQIQYPVERPDIGVMISKEKFSAGRVTARFFALLQFKYGIRDFKKAKAWVTLPSGKIENFKGLSVSGRWANIVGTESVPSNLASFEHGEHLVLSRTLAPEGDQTYLETYCIKNVPEKGRGLKKQVCVQFSIDKARFRPGFLPESAPLGQIRAVVYQKKIATESDCAALQVEGKFEDAKYQAISTIPVPLPADDSLVEFARNKGTISGTAAPDQSADLHGAAGAR
jgi:hypothetical protein